MQPPFNQDCRLGGVVLRAVERINRKNGVKITL